MSLLVFAYNFYLFIYLFILGLKRDEGEICGHQLGHVSIISYFFFFFLDSLSRRELSLFWNPNTLDPCTGQTIMMSSWFFDFLFF